MPNRRAEVAIRQRDLLPLGKLYRLVGGVRVIRGQALVAKSAIPVSYRVRREEAVRWRAYDLDVEGISLVRNYRSQFDSIIRRT